MPKRGVIAGWIAFGAATAAAIAVAAERTIVSRDRSRPDPYATEPYGEVRGKDIGPVPSFDGTNLHVEETGAGPLMLFSHGFSLDLRTWHHQINDLASDTRLVLYDHRGHGLSSPGAGDDYSLDALARDMDAVIAATADGERPIIVGHSMGGMAALTYCAMLGDQVRERIAGLVLVDTTAADVMIGPAGISLSRRSSATFQGLQEAALRGLAGRANHVDRLRFKGSDLSYLGTRLMGFGRTPSPKQVEFVEYMLSSTPTETWVRLIPAMMALDASAVLERIDVPTLVIVGERDRLTPPGAAMRIASTIPDAQLVEVPDAGHTPMLEAHERVTDLLRTFAARTTR